MANALFFRINNSRIFFIFSLLLLYFYPAAVNSSPFLASSSVPALIPISQEKIPPAIFSSRDSLATTAQSLQRAPSEEWMSKTPTQARVIAVYGRVKLLNSEHDVAINLEKGMLLGINAQVESGANSGANFILYDGSMLRLSANSLLDFKRLYRYGTTNIRDTQLFLERGQLESTIEPAASSASKFEVVTPSAVTGVRGTKYQVTVDDSGQQTLVAVLEGAVVVASAGKQLTLKEGFATLASMGQTPTEPRQILAPPDLAAVPSRHTDQVQIPLAYSAGVTAFRVQLTTVDGDIRYDQKTSRAALKISNLPSGRYVLDVRAIDELGVEGHAATKTIALQKAVLPVEESKDEEAHWLYRLLFLTGVIIVLL